MSQEPVKMGFIGFGNMAEAIYKGIAERRVVDPLHVWVTDASMERQASIRATHPVQLVGENREVLDRADVILFVVKPGNMPDVLAEIAPAARPRHLFLSVCAGVRTDTIEAGLRTDACPRPRVVRIMPNTPALIGEGMAGICGGAHTGEEDLELPLRIFRAVGEAAKVEESMMNAVTALTGSGPAYVFYLIEALIDGGVQLGFSPEVARDMVLQLVQGSARLAKESDVVPEELRRRVTSPGGTTAAAIAVLEERKVREAFQACLAAADRRARELGGGPER